MIFSTLALVIMMGSITVYAMLQAPIGDKNIKALANGPEDAKANRAIASVSASGTPPVNVTTTVIDTRNATEAIELTMNCKSPEHLVFTDLVRQVRLTGEPCPDTANKNEVERTQIRNLSNGFAATVFAKTPLHYTTDYISLARGQNNIEITHLLKSGKQETHVYQIERAPASLPQKSPIHF
jgi:hypothetical protein